MSVMAKIKEVITGKKVAELTDPSLQGRYYGLSPQLVASGASLEASLITFDMDAEGIRLTNRIKDGSVFVVNYTPDWVFHLRGWGLDHCLSLRQHADSELAQLIFDFSDNDCDGEQLDAVMLLGEGMPMLLGVFRKAAQGEGAEQLLLPLYRRLRQECEQDEPVAEEPFSCLLPIDPVADRKAINSGVTPWAVEALERAGHNLWTGNDDEITARLHLVALGLCSGDYRVQVQALDTFVLGGRVIGAVPLLVTFMKEKGVRMHPQVLARALDAGRCLLYEARSYNETTEVLRRDFGTDDIAAICQLEQLQVTPEQMDAIEKVAHTRPQSRWTPELQRQLTELLTEFGETIG